MDFDETPEEAAFRAHVRGWLEENCSALEVGIPRPIFGSDSVDDIARAKELQVRLAEAGLAGLAWPKEFGGQAAPFMHRVIFSQESARFDTPTSIFDIGINLVAPSIMAHGTPEQRDRYLRPMLEGREIWCQLFSEPDAGSDLASLRTRAVSDSGEWVIDGQKIWSSGAHFADFGLMPVRTDPDVSKNRGITCFIVDMRSPGLEVRPLRQLTGDSHFNEVFFSGVRLSSDSLLGEVDNGWSVTQTTLMSERMSVSSFELDINSLIALAQRPTASGQRASDDPLIRNRLADVYARAEILKYIGYRLLTALANGRMPGPEGSIAKLAASQLIPLASELSLAIRGPSSTLDEAPFDLPGAWKDLFLVSPAMRIAGGTDEIQRNIISERVLGLPREDDPWRKRPFREQPRTVARTEGG